MQISSWRWSKTNLYWPIIAVTHRRSLDSDFLDLLIIELLNSSIEAAIDRISFEHHGLSKRAKDFGSAAVMLALLLCLITWVYITYPLIQTT
jgi:diacylglycerol kinase (ATP)